MGEALEQHGHEVQYFGMEHEGRCVGNRVNAYTSDMDFHGGGKLSKLTYPIKTIYSKEARVQLRKVLDDFRPDVCHLNNFNYQLTPSIILEIVKWRKETGSDCKIIFTAHDYQLVCPNHMLNNPNTHQKIQYIGKGKSALNEDKKTKKSDYIKQIEELQSQKEAVERELSEMKKQLYKAHLEKDVYEKAAEILKKEMGDDLKDFSNREKAIVIEVLRHKYPVKEILLVFEMAKSSFCYQQQQLKKEDKFAELRKVIINIFDENKRRYGYRRIHIELKKIGWKISEKIVRRIMKEEHLEVRITKRKRYSSYMGEISPAVANKINRDFHSSKPNEKWLTDITEFNIGEKKVYLSPIIDCFDGLPVTWTIGTSPNAELVNTMLDNAIAQLDDGEKPIVHSDRGCHYRWPGWGCGED